MVSACAANKGGCLDLLAASEEMVETLDNTHKTSGATTISLLKHHIEISIRLINALVNANLPTNKLEMDKEMHTKVRNLTLEAIKGRFLPTRAAGWKQIIACVVALRVITEYENQDDEETEFLGRVGQILAHADRENEQLYQVIVSRETRDAKQQERPVKKIKLSDAPDIGNVKKWSQVREYFYNRWSLPQLVECSRLIDRVLDPDYFEGYGDGKKTAADVKRSLVSFPPIPWLNNDDESHKVAKALLDDEDDDEWGFGKVCTEEVGMPVSEGMRSVHDAKGKEQEEEEPEQPKQKPDDDSGSETTSETSNENSAGNVQNGKKRAPEEVTAEAAYAQLFRPPSEDVDKQNQEKQLDLHEDMRGVSPECQTTPPAASTSKSTYDNEEHDAKRRKFVILRDAAVLATIAYGQALHSIGDAGPSENKNIAWACSEISWEVRNKLPLASSTTLD